MKTGFSDLRDLPGGRVTACTRQYELCKMESCSTGLDAEVPSPRRANLRSKLKRCGVAPEAGSFRAGGARSAQRFFFRSSSSGAGSRLIVSCSGRVQTNVRGKRLQLSTPQVDGCARICHLHKSTLPGSFKTRWEWATMTLMGWRTIPTPFIDK